MKTAILLGIGLLVLAVQFSTATEYVCKSLFHIGRNTTDCSKWFICVFGHPFWMSCPDGTVFNLKYSVCVHKGWTLDDCTPISDKCKAGFVQVFSKQDNCAQFYNCSLKPRRPGPGYLGDYVDECPYPKLFSEATGKCESFESVSCGSRKEIKYACNYRKLQCPVAHCRPCYVDYPDCRGLSDGLHVWEQKKGSPYHAYCLSERGFPRSCPSANGKWQIFSQTTRTCEFVN